MRRIRHLILAHYRSLDNVGPIGIGLSQTEFKLGSLNVLIGRNGSGKSNFLSFFRMLSSAANEGLLSFINRQGGYDQLVFLGATDNVIGWGIEFFNEQATPELLSYRGTLYPRGSNYIIAHEEIVSDPEKYYLTTSFEQATVRNELDDALEQETLENSQELAITQLRSRARFPKLAEIRETIADWQVFHGFGPDALENIRGSQLLNPSNPLRLYPDGSNLVSVLSELANNARYDQVNERLNEAMAAVFDDFKRLDTPTVAAGRATLNYRSRYFPTTSIPALSMSDGQLRFLGLAVLLLLPDPPPLIAIDEPEIGMHPKMLTIFAELVKAASERTQVVITTHSPQLLNEFAPEDIIVVERAETGATALHRLEVDKLNVWLERYSLGQLWTMGRLERVATQ